MLLNRELNPNTEILVTAGAYEALFSTIHGHTKPGDEWIIIEPFFDCYEPMVRGAGGVPRFVALKPVRGSQKCLNRLLKNLMREKKFLLFLFL